MAPDVRERLLDDAVAGQVDAGSEVVEIARHGQRDRQVVGGRHERRELGQFRLRAQRRATIAVEAMTGSSDVATQHAEDAAQFVHRLAPGRLDVRQRGFGVVRRRVEAPPGRRRLDHHHAHGVGHHVVEFAGDPGSLVGDPTLRDEFAFAFGPLEPLLEGIGRFAPAAQVVAEHECGDEDDDAGDETADVEFVDEQPGDEQHADRPGGDEQERVRARPTACAPSEYRATSTPMKPDPSMSANSATTWAATTIAVERIGSVRRQAIGNTDAMTSGTVHHAGSV